MLTRIHSCLKRKLPFLFAEKMPVWLTICITILTVLLTYILVPSVNRQFQIEDVRSEHLSETSNILNADFINLSIKIRRLNGAIASRQDTAAELREECLDLVTQLQWRLVDLRVILVADSDETLVETLSDDLNDLKGALDAPPDEDYLTKIRQAMAALSVATRNVLNRLYAKASLQG